MSVGEPSRALGRRERVRLYFGPGGTAWDEERVLDRYELLYEAGLIEEARRDGRPAALARDPFPALGEPMRFDHRRILATAIARLRAKLKYRPLVFELMPAEFTLTELQHTVEAISGRHLHKQNFRRLVESASLVEPTGEMSTATGGRPAALFRFRHEVVIPLFTTLPGVEIAKARQTLSIGSADIGVAKDLQVPVNTPVAEIRRVFVGPDGSVIYLGEATYRGDYIHLEMDLKP